MSDKYFTVNIRAYLDKDEPTYIGEESLYDLLSDFSCPKNPDVEYLILSILVYTFFSRMFDLMLPPVAKHSIVVA